MDYATPKKKAAPAACNGRAPCHSHAAEEIHECRNPAHTEVPLHCEPLDGPGGKKKTNFFVKTL